MKQKHAILSTLLIAASAITHLSCVDNDYDLTKNIDLTITIGGSEFALPGGETEPIKLSKILKVEEDDLVKIDPILGDYYLLKAGTPSVSTIKVPTFEMTPPEAKSLTNPLAFRSSSANVASFSNNSTFALAGTFPKEIKSVSQLDVDMDVVFNLSFTSNATVSKVKIESLRIVFPDFIVSSSLTDNAIVIQNQELTEGDAMPVQVHVSALKIDTNDTSLNSEGKLAFNLNGSLALDATIQMMESSAPDETNTIDFQTNISFSSIDPVGVTGTVVPDINIDISPIDLGNLPSYLSNEEVKLDIKNPMIFFEVDNQAPVTTAINGRFTSEYENSSRDVTVPFRIPYVVKNTQQAYCLSPSNPDMKDTEWIQVSDLPSLITHIPQEIAIDAVADVHEDPSDYVEFDRLYKIETQYGAVVPFVFGNKMTIVYTDTISGWHEDIKKYAIEQIIATGKAVNKIPLNLKVSATAVQKNDQGVLVALPEVTATVFIEGVKDGTVGSGDTSTGNIIPITIEIKDTNPNSIKHLDGLILQAVCDSEGINEGVLNENQTFQLIDVRLKVPGGLTIDLN